MLRNRKLLAVRKLDVSAHRDILNKIKQRLAAGAGRKSEVSLAKSRLALSVARLERAEGDLKNSGDSYIRVIGCAADNNIRDPSTPTNLPHNTHAAQDLAMLSNPTLKVLMSRVEAQAAAVGVARSAFYPEFTLDLIAAYNNNLDGVTGRNEEKLAMVRMTYNLFNGGSDLANLRAAKNRRIATIQELADATRNVYEDVALSHNDLYAAKDRLPSLREHRDESLNVFEAYVKQFKLGQRTLFDLLNAQSEYYDARSNYIDGQYDVKVNSYRLLASMGMLSSTMASQTA